MSRRFAVAHRAAVVTWFATLPLFVLGVAFEWPLLELVAFAALAGAAYVLGALLDRVNTRARESLRLIQEIRDEPDIAIVRMKCTYIGLLLDSATGVDEH